MLLRTVLGFALAFTIGVVCRVSNIPVPAPPAIIGALLVVSMTLGFILVDTLMTRREAAKEEL